MDTLLKNRYQLIRELGHGGMGKVYLARDTLLERDVAVKVLSEASFSRLGTEGRSRLLHEAQAAAALNHPNIVAIYDAGEDQGSSFIVMELVDGESLFDKKPQSIPEIIAIARQVCSALEHAHKNRIIHRDLKPENILVNRDGTVKLTDFGLARSLSSRITFDGMIVGTVFYLAPEAALRQPYDERADLYSLGIILYELTAGCLPFQGDEPLSIISQHLYAPVVPPRACNPNIPPALDQLIVDLMSKQPENRPASAGDVRRVLSLLENVGRLDTIIEMGSPQSGLLDRMIRGRLVGREDEFAELDSAWRSAVDRKGSVLLISGEPGIGKTRLAREMTARAFVSGGRVFGGTCYIEGGMPYAPFPQIIQEVLENTSSGLTLPDTVLQDLLRIAPSVAHLYPHIQLAPLQDHLVEQHRTFDSISMMISAAASLSPVLLFIDDIHWADSTTLSLLRHLARKSRTQRILILLTYREIELEEGSSLQQLIQELIRERLSVRVKLTRFDREQTEALLNVMLSPSGAIHPSLVDAIYLETEGNPFFIEEVTKTLIEEERLAFSAGQWYIKSPESIVIPQSVRITLQTRVARLPQPVQDVLRMAAILGKEFDANVLLKATNLNDDDLIMALESAERAQIISELPGKSGGSKYTFAHNLIATTIQENMSILRRQRLHRQAAQAIEQIKLDDLETLAYHFEQAGMYENAFQYYTRAAERALSLYANQEAERWFRAALELIEHDKPPAEVVNGLGEALFRQNKYAQAVEIWDKACSLFLDSGELENYAITSARRARAAWYNDDADLGLQICLDALKNMPDYAQLETHGIATLIHETGRAYRFANQPEKALSFCQQALAMARKLNLVEVEAETLTTIGILPNQTPEEMRSALERAVQLSESAGLKVTTVRARTNLAEYLRYLGDFHGAYQLLDRGRQITERMRIPLWHFGFLVALDEINIDLSNFLAVKTSLPILKKMLPDLPNQEYNELKVNSLEARLNRFSGNWDTADAQLRQCLAIAEKRHAIWLMASFAITLADMLYELRQYGEAGLLLTRYPPPLEQNPTIDPIIHRTLLSAVRRQQNLIVEAQNLLAEAERLVQVQPSPLGNGYMMITHARHAVIDKRWETAIEIYEQLAQLANQLGATWYSGRILGEWGRLYLERNLPGDLEKSTDKYKQARDIYTKINLPIYAAYYAEQLGGISE